MTTAVGYVRISQDRAGEGLGVERQREAITERAARDGLTITDWYEDNDTSAYAHRPGFEALLDADADVIYVWATDRLYRKFSDLERITDALVDTPVKTCVSGDIDLSTADGRFQARILGSVAARESERQSERIKAKQAQNRRAGKRHGAVPFGWRSEVEADWVRRIVRGLLAGESLSALARALMDAGQPTPSGKQKWTATQVRGVAERWANAALVEADGELVPAEWDALVSTPEMERVRRLLADPERNKRRGRAARVHVLSGILRCGVCGGPMGYRQKNGRPYYQCENHCVTIALAEAEEYVMTAAQMAVDASVRLPVEDEASQSLRDEHEALRGRLDALADDYADGVLDRLQMQRASYRLKERLAEVEVQLRSLEKAIDQAATPGEVLAQASLDRQRAVIQTLFVPVVERANGRKPEERITLQPLDR